MTDIELAKMNVSKKEGRREAFGEGRGGNGNDEHLLSESLREIPELVKVLKSIFTLLDSFDGGGLTIIDVFILFRDENIFEVFQVIYSLTSLRD